jgi:hypothetical protein
MTEAAEPTAPASTGTPIISDAGRLARVLISPTEVFREISGRPTFWGPWVVVSIIYAILNYFQRPFQQRVGQIMLEAAGRTPPPDSMVKAIISACLTPIGVLLICVISGAILYGLMAAMGGESTFKKALTVVIFSWPALLIQTAITVAVLYSRGLDSVHRASDLLVSLGLDLALPADSTIGFFPRFVLAGINPLSIWGLVIVAMGLHVLGKLTKGAAWTAAIIHFAILLLCLSALGAFGMKMAGG